MDHGFGISRDASVKLIMRTCLENGVVDTNQIAYVLATAQHESLNFSRAVEIGGRRQALARGYGGGQEYYGRGYVQLTHKENYQKFDRLLGLKGELAADPELARNPDLAAKILVIGMRDGSFRAHSKHAHDRYELAEFINEKGVDFGKARLIINGITEKFPESIEAAKIIARYATDWQQKLPVLLKSMPVESGVNKMPPKGGPSEALYKQARDGVRHLDQTLHRPFDATSERLAASLAVLARESGLTRIDHVLFNRGNGHIKAGENVFVVQGRLNDPAHHRAHMRTADAIARPVAESLQALARLEAPVQTQSPEHVHAHAHAAPMQHAVHDRAHVR